MERLLYDRVVAGEVVQYLDKRISDGFDVSNTDISDIIELIIQLRGANALIASWGISNEPPIKICTKSFGPIHLNCMDSLTVSLDRKGEESVSLSTKLLYPIIADSVSIYSFTDALGFKNAVMGVFGESDGI